jgi:hypothetical protein
MEARKEKKIAELNPSVRLHCGNGPGADQSGNIT